MVDTTFTLKLSDLFWLATGLTCIIGLAKALKSINPIRNVNLRLDSVEEKLSKDKIRLDDFEKQINNIEKMQDDSMVLVLKSLRALTRNARTGNNTKQLDEVSEELDNYILRK